MLIPFKAHVGQFYHQTPAQLTDKSQRDTAFPHRKELSANVIGNPLKLVPNQKFELHKILVR